MNSKFSYKDIFWLLVAFGIGFCAFIYTTLAGLLGLK